MTRRCRRMMIPPSPDGGLFYSALIGSSFGSGARFRLRLRARMCSAKWGFGHGNGHRDEKKKCPAIFAGHSFEYFPAATYSSTPQGCSTIGPEGLSCRVRNGIGRFPPGITTGKKLQPKPSIVKMQTKKQQNK